ESFAGARDVIADNWALGAGIGNYAKYNANMANSNYANDKDNFLPAWEYQPVHNVFLLVWSEIGIFGLAFFIGLFLFGAYYALRRRTETKDKTEIYKFGLLMAMVVMFMVDHWWWSLHFGVIFFWLILGFLFQEKNKIK
ncbi:MAG: hypothetical protein U9R06_01510, partial [Patescibacteria group bacterium]|nr:hypothetical protein [Patescibacteria group bacterium]